MDEIGDDFLSRNKRPVVAGIVLAIAFNFFLIGCFRSAPTPSDLASTTQPNQQLWMEMCLPEGFVDGPEFDQSPACEQLRAAIESFLFESSEMARLCRPELGFDINGEGQPGITVSRLNNSRFITMIRSYNNDAEDMKVLNVIARQLAAYSPRPLVKIVRLAEFHEKTPAIQDFSAEDERMMRAIW